MCLQLVESAVAPSASEGDDVACFLEFVEVGTEQDRLSKSYRLQDVVNAHAEAASDIGYVGIAVELREHAHVVDNQYFGRGGGVVGKL